MNAARSRLPHRREHEVIEFEHAGIRYTAGVGRYGYGGRVAEVFLDAGKAGTAIATHARDGAVILSLLLQHGCPLEIIRKAVTRLPDGSAAGPFGTLLDLIDRDPPATASAAKPPIAAAPFGARLREIVREVLKEMEGEQA